VRSRIFAVLGVLALLATTSSFVPTAGAHTSEPGSFHSEDMLPEPDGRPIPTPVSTEGLSTAAATPGTTFAGFNGLTSPERLLDTRTGNGAAAAPVGPGQSITVQFAGRGSVPADATAVVMNVTADAPSAGGFVTVYPAGEPVPGTSNINIVPGKTVPNLVVMRLNGGAASFFNAFGTTHVIADVLAYARDDGHFVGFSPLRFLDTRTGIGAPAAKVGAGGRIDVNVLGWGSVPTDATKVGAVVINVTADQPTAPSFVSAWPSGVTMPNASSLNFTAGQTVANLVFAPVGADGRVSFFNESGETHLIGDIVGWVPSGAAYIPITPTRVLDTRTGLGRLAALGQNPASTAPLAPGESILFAPYSSVVPGTLSTTGTVGAYVLNVTAAGPTQKSFLTVYPWGQPLPNASNLNTVAGENVPNAVVVTPGTAGVDVIRNDSGFTHVIVDIVGIVPKQNAADVVDDVGGSRFHVLYLLGSDSTADPNMPSLIRAELEAVNAWMAADTGGASLDFGRTNGQIDVITWRMTGWTQEELLNWEDYATASYYELPMQLLEDGFGFPANHKVLVYINGTRAGGTCGQAWSQFATLFTTAGGCGIQVDGNLGTVGNSADTEITALHEAFHALRAVPTCGGATSTDPFNAFYAHSTVTNDVMYPSTGGVWPRRIDPDHNNYFGHSIPGCTDLADSPYMSNVAG
jgi:hypothetical protein